jgi:dihydroorotate dehydrogenase
VGRDHHAEDHGGCRVKKPYDVLFDGVFSKMDPEKAHEQAFAAIRAGGFATRAWGRTLKAAPVAAMGLHFPNVLGLAAGFDKNAVGIDAIAGLGFGHVEIGTVTGEAQPGNPKPRLFRLLDDRAVVNRMGFNNDGAEVVGRRLAARATARAGRPGPVVGVNIGKTKVVPDDDIAAVIKDHEKSVDHLARYADYLVVNVSSPNTPGLRNLQAVEKLAPRLEAVRRRTDEVVTDRRVPLVVKIAPDLADDDVLAVADMATAIGLDGITATNTTISRDDLASPASRIAEIGAGGLSGRPLTQRSLEVLRLLKDRVGDDLTLIGVGGITTVDDAVARLDAGADLLQGYTAFIYEGPLWPRRIVRGVQRHR